MICASMFWAITRICSKVRLRSVNRARAAVAAIMRADEPEIPAPAGDSESVSTSRPSFGAKNCSRRAAKGNRKRRAWRSSSKLAKVSSRRVSSERRWIRLPFRGVIRQLVRMLTAKLSVSAPEWNRYRGQRSIVPPARSARQGAKARIVPLSNIREDSMQNLYHGRGVGRRRAGVSRPLEPREQSPPGSPQTKATLEQGGPSADGQGPFEPAQGGCPSTPRMRHPRPDEGRREPIFPQLVVIS